MVEGIIYGSISAAIAFFIYIPLILVIGGKIDKFLGFVSITRYFFGNVVLILLAQLVFGMLLGVISSMLATNRYLKQLD
jgi:hypothetical protein